MKRLRGGWFAIRGVWTPASKPEKSAGSGFSREIKGLERGRSKRLRRAAASRRVIGCGGIRPPFSARKFSGESWYHSAFPGIPPGV